MYNPKILYNRNMAKGNGIYKNNSIRRLIEDGIDDKIWPENYQIIGAKSDFKDFIKDKVKINSCERGLMKRNDAYRSN